MSQQDEGMWYPKLPDGYPGQQYDAHHQQSHPQHGQQHQGWPGGYPGYPPPNQQNPQWPPSYPGHQQGYPPQHQPGYPSQPGYPGYPQQPTYPGHSGYPGHPGQHGQHGHHQEHHHHGQPGGQPQQSAPTSAPPSQIPSYPDAQLRAVDPGGIAGCLYRYTYVWTSRNKGFWYYPTFVGRTSIAGYRWDPRHYRWEYYGLDLQKIDSFRCT
ncbi:hypothetical protein CSV80_13865 [Sporosarcina sp. P12(2017)]|uniref:hypothetical protein n=1 Tax=unclassified Sporosarcina TaxID=2647733 RepID=UPI000C16C587|nr:MULTISPECIES: hypothetical protein [unclassified Sporosarcina]PIC56593.1 hypothetical protein CSV81_13300 [Sporosarcina sp. P10]PIC59810.1 hypothetical protein CSV80_13865 [Sporosarcina sp. P12(2017)]